MTDLTTLPVIPLREAVLFPEVTSPIAAGRPGTLRAIEAALRSDDKKIFVVSQKENLEDVTPEILYSMGTVATVGPVQRGPSGMRLLLNGDYRAVAVRYEEQDEYLVASVHEAEELLPIDPDAATFTALYRETRERAAELGRRAGMPKEAVQQFLAETKEPGRFADLVAGHLDLKPGEAQRLLEALSVEDRLRAVLVHIQRQVAVLDAQEDIKSQVQEELGDRQREMFLRQQLKAIQKELGEDGGREDLEELREKLEALELPEAPRQEVDRELNRLERMGPEGMEAQVIRTYLETICELPWSERSEERLDVQRAAEILEEDHYALGDVKDRILEFLAVRILQQKAEASEAEVESVETEEEATEPSIHDTVGRNPILLFAGPPGVGKTSVAKSIARAMDREYVRISLGGVRDEADIRGHRRTYVGAMPGRIIQGMKQAGSKNPVFLLDEVDKLGASYQGDPGAALLEVLDPAQNDSFTDHYLGVPFDLSEVQFICTANFLQNIPGPLQDRMEVVEFAGYTEAEKLEIAKRYLTPRQIKHTGLTNEQISITDDAVREVITRYTRESGVRQLEREIGRLARKVARKIAAEELESAVIDGKEVNELLGRPRVHPEHAAEADQIGVATGMYYTPVGGDIMFVEATPMPGKGELVLTGQLGDVMKESARAAWTYARAHADELFISEDAFKQDVHIHVPAGAIPKDGPSAGVTMATALVSALSGRPARNDVAMTGELTLSGRVLPIGVATGMYYTPVGGDIMFVEATPMPGKGELVLTGQLGDVMKESARAAWTYARAHADELFISEDAFKQDVHIHVPAGAIPKDGPSAGVTMATALVSALSCRPARNDVAMTGELTLSGRVLPIGGVKEKVLGAVRAGIDTVVLPKVNEADLEDLPEEIRDGLKIHLIEELGEALAHTLRGGEFREGRLQFTGSAPKKSSPRGLQH